MSSAVFDVGTELVAVTVDGAVGRITLTDPERHNVLSVEMMRGLRDALHALEHDQVVRVVVLTGAGERAFCAGGDISEFGEKRHTPEARAEYNRGSPIFSDMRAMTKPMIAMIRGYCLGGGLLLALGTDLRVAARGATFSIPAARLGLGYGTQGVAALLEVVGAAWTAEILFSARRLGTDEALRIGLVNRVVDPDDLEAEVADLAAGIAANAPMTVAACKAAITELRLPPDERDLARVNEMVEACFRSADYLEGQAAFLEKRPPRFEGH
jgi:enoyl-CoA hydratase/carnithine racemase